MTEVIGFQATEIVKKYNLNSNIINEKLFLFCEEFEKKVFNHKIHGDDFLWNCLEIISKTKEIDFLAYGINQNDCFDLEKIESKYCMGFYSIYYDFIRGDFFVNQNDIDKFINLIERLEKIYCTFI